MICKECGNEIADGAKFCPICGAPADETFAAPVVSDPSDHTAEFDPDDISRNKLLAVLCYFSLIGAVIALIAEPQSKFIRFHINQNILLYAFVIASSLVMIVPILGWIVGGIGYIAATVFAIMAIVRCCKGKAIDLPLLGKYTVLHWD